MDKLEIICHNMDVNKYMYAKTNKNDIRDEV